jgi:hypothetical protein
MGDGDASPSVLVEAEQVAATVVEHCVDAVGRRLRLVQEHDALGQEFVVGPSAVRSSEGERRFADLASSQ